MTPTNGIVTLAEKPYELRFDIPALTSAQAVLKAMGFKRENVWSLADEPYDLQEEIILFVNGVNGARRLAKENRMMTAEEAQDVFQAHFDWLSDKVSSIEDEVEAMKMFQDEHTRLMDSLADAIKKSIGFRRKGPKGGSPTNPVG